LIGGQGAYLAGVMPPGLASLLGATGWQTVAPPAQAYERVVDVPAVAYERNEPPGRLGWLKWAIPLLLLPLAFLAWRAWRPAEPVGSVGRPGASDAGPARTLPAVALVTRTLSCGRTIDVAPDGVESKLIAFVDDPARPVNDTTWFTFDRLEFETASATLLPASQPQLRNIATIMNCYPNVSLKVGGYTDNVGDAPSNRRLSQARADNTMAAIVANGIAASRLEAEGYGEQHPVASNDTAEGRQRNRRIDLRVTRK
jgi:outer membrane protein OmpA-like peptidoglycan-associated protein